MADDFPRTLALSAVLRELVGRQPALARFAMILLGLLVPVLIAGVVDHRTIDGVGVWVKPAKFLLSFAVFAATIGWSYGYVRPDRRSARPLRWLPSVLIGTASFELGWITWQGAHGLASHFNRSTLFFGVMYALMGVGAFLLIGTTLPLAWEIVRRPVAGVRADFRAAVVLGLLMCCGLGGGLGFYMAQQTGHAVGAIGGATPLFGWNRCGGDLRVAHFLGVHAQQAIPALALLIGWAGTRTRWTVVVVGSIVYAGLTLGIFSQALAGHALLPAAAACRSDGLRSGHPSIADGDTR